MLKSQAIELLGGSVASVAEAIGISYQAVDKWPDELPARIADRVQAALARKHLPPELIGAGGSAQDDHDEADDAPHSKPLSKLTESPFAAEPRRERRLSERNGDEQTSDPLLAAARRIAFSSERR